VQSPELYGPRLMSQCILPRNCGCQRNLAVMQNRIKFIQPYVSALTLSAMRFLLRAWHAQNIFIRPCLKEDKILNED
jgi:hypothetical protein